MFAALIAFTYECFFWLFGILFIFTHSYRVEFRRRVPRSGPVLFIANHQSYLDIFPLGLASPRRLFFLAKKMLFGNGPLATLMLAFDTVAIDSEGMGRSGLEGILAHMKNGKSVLIFPEGERCWDGKLAELKPGVSLLIRKAKAPVVPLGLAGSFEAWPRFQKFPRLAPPFRPWNRCRIAVSVGEPLDGVKLAEMPRDAMMATLRVELLKAMDQADRLRGGARCEK